MFTRERVITVVSGAGFNQAMNLRSLLTLLQVYRNDVERRMNGGMSAEYKFNNRNFNSDAYGIVLSAFSATILIRAPPQQLKWRSKHLNSMKWQCVVRRISVFEEILSMSTTVFFVSFCLRIFVMPRFNLWTTCFVHERYQTNEMPRLNVALFRCFPR